MSRLQWAVRAIATVTLSSGLLGASVSGTWAAGEGSIDHAEAKDGALRVLYSVPDLPDGVEPDLGTMKVTLDGEAVEAEAELATSAEGADQVRRTTIMAIDTSNSMRGERFEQAKAAAKAFLDSAPDDVHVGIVAFAGSVEVVQEPTLDRAAAAAVLDGLSLSLETRLNDGVIAATKAAGTAGQRSLLVLSDGRDTSDTELQAVVDAIAGSEVRVHVVALGEAAEANAPLQEMASAGDGDVVAAADPDALTALFNDEAAALARQVLVTATLPEGFDATEGSVAVALDAGGETYSDSAFVSFGKRSQEAKVDSTPKPVTPPSTLVTDELMLAGLVALGLGVLVALLGAFGVLGGGRKADVEDQISVYTRAGAAKGARSAALAQQAATTTSPKNVAASAVDLAQKALAGNASFESRLGAKLEGAGLALKPAEWILIHAGIALGAAAFGLLLSSGRFLLALLGLLVGALLPWIYLGLKKSRRVRAFNGQLAETLQLISGSLSAGLSLAQGLDTVVREGSDPVASEFRRALVEARLGVAVEDALDSVAKRMESADFEWIVMAIRIQREVGGNLAELLTKVAATMREREYLRRQVKALSAEGKMSAYILGGLPPGVIVYMMLVNPDYLHPLIATPLGWLMLAAAAMLMAVGAFWMSRVVKVEV